MQRLSSIPKKSLHLMLADRHNNLRIYLYLNVQKMKTVQRVLHWELYRNMRLNNVLEKVGHQKLRA
eukprot:7548912-Pyramimonas_sp.AAC.1